MNVEAERAFARRSSTAPRPPAWARPNVLSGQGSCGAARTAVARSPERPSAFGFAVRLDTNPVPAAFLGCGIANLSRGLHVDSELSQPDRIQHPMQKGNIQRPRSAEEYRKEAVRCRNLAGNKAFTAMTRKNFELMAVSFEELARQIDVMKPAERDLDASLRSSRPQSGHAA